MSCTCQRELIQEIMEIMGEPTSDLCYVWDEDELKVHLREREDVYDEYYEVFDTTNVGEIKKLKEEVWDREHCSIEELTGEIRRLRKLEEENKKLKEDIKKIVWDGTNEMIRLRNEIHKWEKMDFEDLAILSAEKKEKEDEDFENSKPDPWDQM
jgi:galactokinase